MSSRPSLGRLVLVASLVWLAFFAWFRWLGPYSGVARWAGDRDLAVPEACPGQPVASVQAFLDALSNPADAELKGPASRVKDYYDAQVWDFGNALLIGLAAQLALIWLAVRAAPGRRALRLLAVLPVLYAFVDMTENNAMIATLSRSPLVATPVLPALTSIKFATLGAAVLAAIGLALAIRMRRRRGGGSGA